MACSPDVSLPHGTAADRPWLDALFLGPYGENDALLEKLVVEFLRDHVYWRRNFHPEDPPAIPTHAAQHPGYQAFEARMRRELHQLSAALKRSVPFHSPRYIGHMASDLLLPGLAAQILALPYNPNNVSEDAAPVTIDMEVKANRAQVVKVFRDALARDKTRTQVFDISELGLVQMTRKRIGEGLLESFTHSCEVCDGRGVVFEQDLLN